jgi:phosphate/sulfate permease
VPAAGADAVAVVVISPVMAFSVAIVLSIWMRRYLPGVRERRIRTANEPRLIDQPAMKLKQSS